MDLMLGRNIVSWRIVKGCICDLRCCPGSNVCLVVGLWLEGLDWWNGKEVVVANAEMWELEA